MKISNLVKNICHLDFAENGENEISILDIFRTFSTRVHIWGIKRAGIGVVHIRSCI